VVEMVRNRAIENNEGRIPIEGFYPELYKGVYPGLIDEDFDGAAAIGGTFRFSNGQLIFDEEEPGLQTSADGTINDEGVITLTQNVAKRLNSQIRTLQDLESILDTISNNNSSNNKVYCTPQDREGDACIMIYDPVCGWSDPAKVQCIKFPCAQTYGNSCQACQDETVLYYTPGVCPEN
jgi:hypothetical protein